MKQRFLAIILALAMALLLLPTAAQAAGENGIQLGTGGIGADDKVYFGKYTESSTDYNVPWYVLPSGALSQTSVAQGANVIPLLSEYLLGASEYEASGQGYYLNSTLQGAMGTVWNGFHSTERGAVADTTLAGNSMYTGQNDLSGQKLFPPSFEETKQLIWFSPKVKAAYISDKIGGRWWPRTLDYMDLSAYCIHISGDFGYQSLDAVHGVRPAFHLDTSKVLFTSAAEHGKDCTPGELNQNLTPSGATDWKLTLLDSSRSGFSARLNAAGSATVAAGDSVRIDYSGAQTGTNEYVSAMLVSGSDVLYYGRIVNNSASGTAQAITIPAGLAAGSYTLKIFNEQYNGDYKTDYASDFTDIPLTVTAPAIPAIIDPTANKTVPVAVGSPATMTVTAVNASGYQWRINRGSGAWEALPGATSASYTTAPVTLANDGYQYYCQVFGIGAVIESRVFTLRVTEQPVIPSAGDDASPFLWLGLALTAICGLAAAGTLLRRKRRE